MADSELVRSRRRYANRGEQNPRAASVSNTRFMAVHFLPRADELFNSVIRVPEELIPQEISTCEFQRFDR